MQPNKQLDVQAVLESDRRPVSLKLMLGHTQTGNVAAAGAGEMVLQNAAMDGTLRPEAHHEKQAQLGHIPVKLASVRARFDIRWGELIRLDESLQTL